MRWDLDSAAMEDLSQKTKMEMFRDQIGVDQGCGKDEGGNPHMCCDGPLGREKWMTGGECVNKLYSPFAMGSLRRKVGNVQLSALANCSKLSHHRSMRRPASVAPLPLSRSLFWDGTLPLFQVFLSSQSSSILLADNFERIT